MAENQPQAAPPAAFAPAPPPEETIDLRAYLAVLLKRKWSIAAVFLLVVAAVGVWTARQPKIYKASTSVIIDPRAPKALNDVNDVIDLGAGSYWATKEFYETEYKVIQSREVAERVVRRLGLDKDPDFLGVSRIEDPQERKEALEDADAAGILQSMISVEPVRDSRMVMVSVSDTDPKRAALLSNTIAEAYRDQNVEKRTEGTSSVVEWLDEQLKELKPRLEASEMALYEFRKNNDMLTTSLQDRQSILSQRLFDLNKALTDIRTRRVQLESKVQRVKRLQAESKGDVSKLDTLADVADSTLIQQLKGNVFDKVQEVASLKERYLDKHPKLIAAEQGLRAARATLDREVDKIVAGIQNEYAQLLDSEKATRRLLEEAKAEAFEVNKKEIAYNRLDREKKDNERLYDLVLGRMKEANISGQQKTNNIRIVDAALVPLRPIKPRFSLNMLLAAVVGLFLGVGLAFAREYLDNTVKGQEDVEGELGIPFLGLIPLVSERAQGGRSTDMHILSNPRGPVAEACRSIRTNLLFMSPERPLKRLVVTSGGPREGKTTTVIDMGIVMAQSGASVVLIDTDMRRPRLHKAFGVPGEVGLSSLILGEASIDDALKTTEVPGLSILPCGPIPPNPAELLHTERFEAILSELGERFDRIILDSPPLGAVADAKVLSVITDGTLLVAKSHQTTKDMLAQAAGAILDVNGRILGVVLNQVDLEKREYGYYYYQYYRQYGAYGEDEKGAAKSA